jgi:hypothetical protein
VVPAFSELILKTIRPPNWKGMVNNIVAGKINRTWRKVEAIYHWVQQNIKYIAIEDGLGGLQATKCEYGLQQAVWRLQGHELSVAQHAEYRQHPF